MGKIYRRFEELVGNTPMVELAAMNEKYREEYGIHGRVFAKLEWFNPGGSAKDRIALKMIEEAEKAGTLKEGGTIIEPTSGNTGIGLSAIARRRGYRAIIVMPESMSEERKKLMKAHFAELVLTPASQGMKGAIAKAQELAKEIPGAWIPDQFRNPAGPLAHYLTTGPEIWEAMDGRIDVFVSGVGTGGTLTGAGKYLKEKNPDIKIIAVEPKDSPVLSGGQPGPHKIQGIGAGFIPEILDQSLIDEIFEADVQDAYARAHDLASLEGHLCGISSGAALSAAYEIAKRPEMEGKNIVAFLTDGGERYLSTELYSK